MLKSKLILLTFTIFLFIGCGYKQTNTQIRDTAFLKFNKNSYNAYTVEVNESLKFKLNACIEDKETNNCYDDTKDKLYQVPSGNVLVKVFDMKNKLITQEELYLGSSNTKEINLP